MEYKLINLTEEEVKELETVMYNEEFEKLGYKYMGKLCEWEGHEDKSELMFLTAKINKDTKEVKTAVFYDHGHRDCHLYDYDVECEELLNGDMKFRDLDSFLRYIWVTKYQASAPEKSFEYFVERILDDMFSRESWVEKELNGEFALYWSDVIYDEGKVKFYLEKSE